MEYKVLDDKAVADLGGIGDGALDGEADENVEEAELGGFYFETLGRRRPELKEKLSELRETVTAAEGDASSLKVTADGLRLSGRFNGKP